MKYIRIKFSVCSSDIEADGAIITGQYTVNEINDTTLSGCNLPCLER